MTPLDFVSYPYSHSLLFLMLWGIAMGWVCQLMADDRGTFLLIAALVVSHWVLDWVTHRPDMPVYPGGPKLGLGLWNSIPATVTLELAMYAIGIWIYARATKPRDRIGRWAFWALAVFLVLVYFGNIFNAPPPSITALWIAALIGAALLTLWAWWADRHRAPI